MSRPAIFFLLLLLVTGLPASSYGKEKPARFFAEQGELEMELDANWKAVFAGSDSDSRNPGKLTLQVPGNATLVLDVQLRARGISRKRTCRFPPLKIYFDEEQLQGTALRGIKSLKLVTHCSSSKRFSSYYVKEFLIYRAYNEITPLSFRVRSVGSTYTDSLGKRKPVTEFAFFIEDVDDMAKRNDLNEIETGRIKASLLDARTSSLYSVFQYMIGNLDWAAINGHNPAVCCHNSKLIGSRNSDSVYYPVPYDFDSSGLVGAHYALPPEGLRVRRITDRLYRGFCFHNDLTEASLETFKLKKEAILALFRDESRLDKKNRQKALSYLDKFFDLIEKPGSVEKKFNNKCRGRG